ncbi:hypothetical protein [Aliikangiella coralliicola]|uniref:Uncharacterized protein n=1 Tax=Aliikangiella coralliicola TaxID=2592383 RepID=A0A545U4I2_9GAMM|nr:hypothetical protein [Aliikangiella coralliicola]TQV84354.1 hypothetical protein FLL46_22275 [Aliikangiella coralliicola]
MNYIKIIKNSVVLVLIGFLTLLATSNKSLYEQIFSSWLAQCRIAIETRFETNVGSSDTSKSFAYVSVFAFGDAPEEMLMRFKSKVPMHKVEMLQSRRNNRLLHQDVARFCPDTSGKEHCQTDAQTHNRYPQIDWNITAFSANLNPVFRVELSPGDKELTEEVFTAYVVNSASLKQCKVEQVSAWNFWAWGSKGYSIMLLLAILIVLTALIQILRSSLNESKSETAKADPETAADPGVAPAADNNANQNHGKGEKQ